MIFSERSIQQILTGKKTCTRRLVKEGEEEFGGYGAYPEVVTKLQSVIEKEKARLEKEEVINFVKERKK